MHEKSPIKILFVGGGTGGHFYPLISIAESLNTSPSHPRLYYAGPDPYDADALKRESISFVRIPAGKRRRYVSVLNFFDLFKTFFGFLCALLKLFIIYPDVIISKGGFTSVPVVLAGAFLRIPIIVHESDAVMGSANKLGTRFAQYVITSYEGVSIPKTSAKTLCLGIPIRNDLRSGPSRNALKKLNIDPERPVLLVLGGSQGAERINSFILDSLDELLVDFSIIHQTGAKNFDLCVLTAQNLIPDTTYRQHYHPFPFLEAQVLNDAYHVAQIVISRAGSTSIYEIALHEKPSILIPIPEEISHDQRTNAYAYARISDAVVLEEDNLSDDLLRAEIDRIMHDDTVYARMVTGAKKFAKNNASEQIVALVESITKQH